MGGEFSEVNFFGKIIKKFFPKLKIGWYYGGGFDEKWNDYSSIFIDYIKVGPYIEQLGPLNNPNTNQKMYERQDNKWKDITFKFWKDARNNY